MALAAARHRLPGLDVRIKGLSGRPDAPPLTVYASDQAHSSIDKAAIVLGLGPGERAPDRERRRLPDVRPGARRRRSPPTAPPGGCRWRWWPPSAPPRRPASIPCPAIADLCAREGIWLHVDAAYAGCGRDLPRAAGGDAAALERADSLVVNPHKWLFTPVDCSVLYVRDPALLRAAFSLVPEYLRTAEEEVTNLMDYGFQLGRRFRALKLWMVIRAFGVEGLRERIREHCALARELAARIEADPGFELAAPVPFSTVCFRARLEGRRKPRTASTSGSSPASTPPGPSSSPTRRSRVATPCASRSATCGPSGSTSRRSGS